MDPWRDDSTRDLRGLLMAPLVAHAAAALDGIDEPKVLDVGCGDLLLARLTPRHWRIEGWDPSPAATTAARRTATELGERVRVVELDEVEPGSIHLATLHSVSQYLDGVDELARLLGRIGPLLTAPDDGGRAGQLVMTDVVDPPRRRWREGWDLLSHLTRHAGPLRAFTATLRTADRSPGRLQPFSAPDLDAAAADGGLSATRLPSNLTPLHTRASYQIVARPAPEAGRQ